MQIGKTKVKLHFTILLLLFIVIANCISAFSPSLIRGILSGSILSAVLIFIILFHEMAHIKAAEFFGFQQPSSVTLWGLGGVAEVKGLEDARPHEEFFISLAGPASNFVLAGIVALVNLLIGIEFSLSNIFTDAYSNYAAYALNVFFCYNLILGIFNLIPAFPMDGGRILRSFLAMFMKRLTATKVAVFIGCLFAGLFIFIGIWGASIMLILIACFTLFTSWAEVKRLKDKQRVFKCDSIQEVVGLYRDKSISKEEAVICLLGFSSYTIDRYKQDIPYDVLDAYDKLIDDVFENKASTITAGNLKLTVNWEN